MWIVTVVSLKGADLPPPREVSFRFPDALPAAPTRISRTSGAGKGPPYDLGARGVCLARVNNRANKEQNGLRDELAVRVSPLEK